MVLIKLALIPSVMLHIAILPLELLVLNINDCIFIILIARVICVGGGIITDVLSNYLALLG